MEAISLELLGVLGRATKQAVHQAGDPVGWLEARVRRELVPQGKGTGEEMEEEIGGRAEAFREAVEEELARRQAEVTKRQAAERRGRPRKEDAQALAKALGVAGATMIDVFRAFLKRQVEVVMKMVVKGPPAELNKKSRLHQMVARAWNWLRGSRLVDENPAPYQLQRDWQPVYRSGQYAGQPIKLRTGEEEEKRQETLRRLRQEAQAPDNYPF